MACVVALGTRLTNPRKDVFIVRDQFITRRKGWVTRQLAEVS